MADQPLTEKEKELAAQCVRCGRCGHAQKARDGVAFWKEVRAQGLFCPFNVAFAGARARNKKQD